MSCLSRIFGGATASLLERIIPSRAAIVGALAALFAAMFAWSRRDARRDLKKDIEHKDLEHAHEVDTRVARDRADPERLHPFDDAGYRD